MRPCTPTLIVRQFRTSTWEDLGLVAAYNTVVRALPESACFLLSPCAFKKNSFALEARQYPSVKGKKFLDEDEFRGSSAVTSCRPEKT
jgi:hypothetical protein